MLKENLKRVRVESGLNKTQVAKELGIPYTTYDSYERGRSLPKIETIRAIASVLNVPTNYLLGNEPFDNMEAINNNEEAIIDSLSKCIGFANFLKKNHISKLQDITYIQYLDLIDKYIDRIDIINEDGKGFQLSYKIDVVPSKKEMEHQRKEVRHAQAVNALLNLPEKQREAVYTIIEAMNGEEEQS